MTEQASYDSAEDAERLEDTPVETRPPVWQKTVTVLVYVLAVAAFLYIGHAILEQRKYRRLIDELFSVEAAVSEQAASQLASTDASYPYLCSELVRRVTPEHRSRCADVILRRIETKEKTAGPFASDDDRTTTLRAALNLEAITSAFSDESPEVRWKAFGIIAVTSVLNDANPKILSDPSELIKKLHFEQNYQRTRCRDMLAFDALMVKLAGDVPTAEKAAAELREAGVRALPSLVGVVFARDDRFILQGRNVLSVDGDATFRTRGLETLRTIVNDVLQGSNQRRIVPLLGRRRCRLLLEELTRCSDNAIRGLITDVLDVSGRLDENFFTTFLADAADTTHLTRSALLDETVRALEHAEKIRGETPAELRKGLKGAGKTDSRP